MALFLLYESASGYSLFEVHGVDEIGQNTEAVRNSVSDLNRFGKVVKLRSFNPFTSALDALKQCNAVSEGNQTNTLILLFSARFLGSIEAVCYRDSIRTKFISIIIIFLIFGLCFVW